MNSFKLTSKYKPTGDQPEAIDALVKGLEENKPAQVLLGVTGSGKTFTIANVISRVERPTLILSHNKTLAAQLYEEMKGFFPDNAVEYYVSYYDYYQPEAYVPQTDTYIEKDLAINEEIDRLRLSAVSALLSGRRDVIVVSSVSCIYGMGAPMTMKENTITVTRGKNTDRNDLLRKLVDSLYIRNDLEITRGTFRVKGDTVDVFPAYSETVLRIEFYDDEIESITEVDPVSFMKIKSFDEYTIYPANLFVTSKDTQEQAIRMIQDDLVKQILYFEEIGDKLKAARIKERVEYDIEMIKELGHCAGIENYSRYFDGREAGQKPYCLLDFFPKDFLMVIDESHVSLPQLKAMYGGDRSRKQNLVEYGFRLPAAFDNRPLTYDEFRSMVSQVIYVSATPAETELEETEGEVVEQIIRPTGLLDPEIEVRPAENQIDDLGNEIKKRIERHERCLVTTITKRDAEDVTAYLIEKYGFKTNYIHSEVATLDRVKIMSDLRAGVYDVLVGVNLLREGLDLPEVSLVAILDAQHEGLLRSYRSLTQTAGRAARNVNGKVIMYADRITKSMQQTIEETLDRRMRQMRYNEENGITPTQIVKSIGGGLIQGETLKAPESFKYMYVEQDDPTAVAADPIVMKMSAKQLEKSIEHTKKLMLEASKKQEYIQAAQYRDEMLRLEKMLKEL